MSEAREFIEVINLDGVEVLALRHGPIEIAAHQRGERKRPT